MDKLPENLIYDILLRCPVKAVESFVSAYPACAAVVRRNSFYIDFLRQSPYIQQDRALLVTRVESTFPEPRKWNFRSTSIVEQEDIKLLCTNTLPLHDKRQNKFMNYSCGLLCSGFGEYPIVFNPTNGRYRILPGVFCGEKEKIRSFIGFSSTSGFSVIAIKKNVGKMLSFNTMVWKPIHCNLLYEPYTASVCIKGIIYYAAYETLISVVLVSFNIETETFQIIKIPQPPIVGHIFCEKIINVNGKVGISFAVGGHMIRILENPAKQLWSERLIKPPTSIWNDRHLFSLSLEGFTYNGETVFAQKLGITKVIYYYDEVNDSVRKHIYEGLRGSQTLIFLDHVDCTLFL